MAGEGRKVYFIINLLQDVNIVRGLAYLVARETAAEIGFLVTEAFIKRDRQKIWQREIAAIAADTRGALFIYGSVAEARTVLEGGSGMIFAAAESNLSAHREVTEVFLAAPAAYLRVTLQHGFECVGFVQSREHVISHGRNISFAADIACGWFEAASLTSLTASQRAKLYVSGPSILLQARATSRPSAPETGLICENLHSVRLRASGDHKASFMDIFFAFCARMRLINERVTLRPHPGGQYVLKNKVELPANVTLDNRPIFRIDLRSYRFGISAPSTIIFDMILAGIPVAVWRDPGGLMDASNYEGLTEISTLDDWLAFERDVRLRPEMILDRQDAFLRRLAMPTDPNEIYCRFAKLIVAGLSRIEDSGARGEGSIGTTMPIRRAKLSGDMLTEAGT
jgi:hypothetical protein